MSHPLSNAAEPLNTALTTTFTEALTTTLTQGALLVALVLPLALLVGLGLATLAHKRLPERRLYQLLSYSFGGSFAAVLTAWGTSWALGLKSLSLSMGSLVSMGGYTLSLSLSIDSLSFVMLSLTFALCGLIAVMSSKYMHREEGSQRYALALTVLAVSVALVASAQGLDLLFVGWELLGVASALLIAFFHERSAPVESGLRAYAVYRFTDVGLLAAVVTAHHLYHDASWSSLASHASSAPWLLGALLVWGAMGKAATFPFTGWLPRAMEGPTPSSAIFYGALSIHASPYLLLRADELIMSQTSLRVLVFVLGTLTFVQASLSARVQSDVKSALGFASVAQVALMWVEVALGWHTLVMWHIVGHATYRTWQLIRSPSVMQERHEMMRLLGEPHAQPSTGSASPLKQRLYRLALERWYLDELLAYLWRRFSALLSLISTLDERLIALLSSSAPLSPTSSSSPAQPSPAQPSSRPAQREPTQEERRS